MEHIRQRYEVYEVDALLYSQAKQLFDVRLECAREKMERETKETEQEEKIQKSKEINANNGVILNWSFKKILIFKIKSQTPPKNEWDCWGGILSNWKKMESILCWISKMFFWKEMNLFKRIRAILFQHLNEIVAFFAKLR